MHGVDAVATRCQRRVMRDEHQGCAHFTAQPEHQIHDALAGRRIKISRGFIGEHQPRAADKRARQRHPLLLTSRQQCRAVMQTLPQADSLQQGGGQIDRALRPPGNFQR